MENLIHQLPALNAYAVVASAAVMIAVGSIWYSPFLFGKAWVRHTGIRPNDIRPAEMRRNYLIGAIVALLTAYLLGAMALHIGHSRTLFCGAGFVWLFVMFEQLSGFLWRRDPFALFLLQAFRSLFSLMAGALVFYLWG